MSWSHILIEGFCTFDPEKDVSVPSCCVNGIGNTGINCFLYDKKIETMCPFFGYQEAKSTMVLTNNIGKTIQFDSFESDEADESKWREDELNWINKKVEIIKTKEI